MLATDFGNSNPLDPNEPYMQLQMYGMLHMEKQTGSKERNLRIAIRCSQEALNYYQNLTVPQFLLAEELKRQIRIHIDIDYCYRRWLSRIGLEFDGANVRDLLVGNGSQVRNQIVEFSMSDIFDRLLSCFLNWKWC